jgi:uncharacterized protein YndB with AHSA1/START domain
VTVVGTTKDPENLTLTLIADLAAPPARVWQVWVDPRQIERWWGPPTWPATFVQHDVAVGGTSRYYMTGPAGEQAHGWWRITALDEPRSLEFEDGFADDTGRPSDDLPVTEARVDLEETASGTRMTIRSRFASLQQMEQVLAMGAEEGLTSAVAQIDEVLLQPA